MKVLAPNGYVPRNLQYALHWKLGSLSVYDVKERAVLVVRDHDAAGLKARAEDVDGVRIGLGEQQTQNFRLRYPEHVLARLQLLDSHGHTCKEKTIKQ